MVNLSVCASQYYYSSLYVMILCIMCITTKKQDKVGSFSGFDQQDLLTETEKTLSASQHLYKEHMELIESERDLNSGDNNVESIQANLDKLTAERQRYEREKSRMEEREKAEQEVDLIKKKILWLTYNLMTVEFQEGKDEKAAVKEELKKSEEELQPLESHYETLMERQEQVGAIYRTLEQKATKLKREIEKESKKSDKLDETLDECISLLATVDSEKTMKKKAYEDAKMKVEQYKEKMSDFPPYAEIEQAYVKTTQEKKAAHRACVEARKKCDELQGRFKAFEEEAEQIQSKLSDLKDEKRQQERAFFQHNPNQYKAVQWIDKNRKEFRRKVWGPIACEVSMKSKSASCRIRRSSASSASSRFRR